MPITPLRRRRPWRRALRRRWTWWLVLLLTACSGTTDGGAPDPTTDPADADADAVRPNAGGADAARPVDDLDDTADDDRQSADRPGGACRPVEGIDGLLRPGRAVLLGEIHGTEQVPAFVARVVCTALEAGRPVVVGLELPDFDQDRIDTFLASAGGPEAEAALFDSVQWVDHHDGRTSRAMVGLLDQLRVWTAADQPVSVAALDLFGRTDRDRAMADAAAAALDDRPDAVLVALTGNVHSPVVEGSFFDPDYEPFGLHLATLLGPDRVTALDMASSGGTAWVCTPDCGPTDFSAIGSRAAADQPDRIEASAEPGPDGFHGSFWVGAITASPPAVPGADD